MRDRGDAFGADYRDNFFSAQFNTHRVRAMSGRGATSAAGTEDSWWAPIPIFTPPTCWKTPTEAC